MDVTSPYIIILSIVANTVHMYIPLLDSLMVEFMVRLFSIIKSLTGGN